MSPAITPGQTIWHLIEAGGFTMYPLVLFSIVSWGVILERLWNFRKLGAGLREFQLEASNLLLRGDLGDVERLCRSRDDLPSARILLAALERLSAKDSRLKDRWAEALERQRQRVNQDLRRNFWILGTIGSASPFVGLFGTVVGILRSFQDMARTGSGGFAVVASGISESLIATAAGIIVAVIAVMAYNAFQTRWSSLVLAIKLQVEELTELLPAGPDSDGN